MSVSRKEWFEGIAALRCALVLALGAPLLGGCAASHVGNAWQCPLVQGQPCVSVADADPAGAGARQTGAREGDAGAGPDKADMSVPVSETPLYRTAAAVEAPADDTSAQPSRMGCRAGCRPFAWLRRLGRHGTVAPSDAGVGEADTDIGEPGEALEMRHTETSTVQDPKVDDLRTPEVIGRIWIAPYVDAHGVYHEASWVRVVFEAAGWKLP
ncbi:MAG: type IV conjugative transfer system lipoprotein TraV [Rhodospirillales bacterium]|nr:type IV conjugative transfer system lipoprotein TraV [Rhodospirillales bacterium]